MLFFVILRARAKILAKALGAFLGRGARQDSFLPICPKKAIFSFGKRYALSGIGDLKSIE